MPVPMPIAAATDGGCSSVVCDRGMLLEKRVVEGELGLVPVESAPGRNRTSARGLGNAV